MKTEIKKLLIIGLAVPFFTLTMQEQLPKNLLKITISRYGHKVTLSEPELNALGLFSEIIKSSKQKNPPTQTGKKLKKKGHCEFDISLSSLRDPNLRAFNAQELAALPYMAKFMQTKNPKEQASALYNISLQLLPSAVTRDKSFMEAYKQRLLLTPDSQKKLFEMLDGETQKKISADFEEILTALQSENSITDLMKSERFPNECRSGKEVHQNMFYTMLFVQRKANNLLKLVKNGVSTLEKPNTVETMVNNSQEQDAKNTEGSWESAEEAHARRTTKIQIPSEVPPLVSTGTLYEVIKEQEQKEAKEDKCTVN